MRSKSKRGFSMIEMMAVLAIGGILLGLAVQGSMMPRDQLAPENAARQFGSLVREARFLAMQHRMPTRIVFIPQSLTVRPPEEGEEDPYVQCLIYRFTVPPASSREVVWRLPGDQNAVRGGDALERIPVTAPGLPEELIGQWKRVPVKALRLDSSLDRPITLETELFERFEEQDESEFAEENGWRPPHLWSAGSLEVWQGYSQSSPYPENYHQTPLPDGPPLVNSPLPSSARLFDPQMKQWRSAADYWDEDSSVTHFEPADEDAIRWHHLPYIEFDAHGHIQTRWTSNLELTFSARDRPGTAFTLSLGQEDFAVRFAQAEP